MFLGDDSQRGLECKDGTRKGYSKFVIFINFSVTYVAAALDKISTSLLFQSATDRFWLDALTTS